MKAILVVFLVLTGLILLLVAMVFFVPIRYRLAGEVCDNHAIKLSGGLCYGIFLCKVLFSYQNGAFDHSVLVCGIRIKKKPEEPDLSEEEKPEEIEREQMPDADEEYRTEKEASWEREPLFAEEEEAADKKPGKVNTQSKRKQNFSKKNLGYWKQQITDEHNKNVVKKLFSEFLYLLKHFRFRKIKTNLVFSAGDPALTGQILGILCMIPVLYRYECKLVPDFEADNLYIKGTFLVQGRIRLVHVFITAFRLLFDKEVKRTVRKIIAMMG